MKVLQLSKYYPPFRGGVELVANMITKAHRELDDHVHVISFGEEQKQYDGQHGEPVDQFKTHLKLISTPLNFLLPFVFLHKIKKISPNIIYVHLPNPLMHFLVSFFKPFLKNTSVIAIYHSDIINQKKLAPIYNYYFSKTSSVYKKIIVSSDNLWINSQVLNKFSSNKKFILHYCSESQQNHKTREKFNGNILAIGRFVPYKGFHFLAEAISKSQYKLTIIGDGPEYQSVKSVSGENIHLPGKVSESEKLNLIDQSDLLIVSSLNTSEAYGMIIVEAFESGLPVIANDIPSGVTFLAKDRERGLVVPVNDQQSLLDGLKFLEDNPEKFKQYSINARQFFDEYLSFERFKEKISQLRNIL